MPNQEDRTAIDGLFDRIEDVARNSPPRDRESELQIQQRLQEFPPAPYYIAQTILIQEQALREAQARIQQLESQGQQRGGGFLGGMFGSGEPVPQSRRRGPWDRGSDYDERPRMGGVGGMGGGGGFLAGAAQTALGVTGGVLLGSALAGMFTGEANADEYSPNSGADAEADAGADGGAEQMDAGAEDFGGGDFDMGGDF